MNRKKSNIYWIDKKLWLSFKIENCYLWYDVIILLLISLFAQNIRVEQ